MRAVAGMLMVALPILAGAQWHVTESGTTGSDVVASVASVDDPAGNSLRVRRDGNGNLVAEVVLAPGLDAFASCPTLLIDSRPPVVVSDPGGACRLAARSARFTLGRVIDAEVVSPITLALMNGKQLRFLVRLREGGYRRIDFSLRGSKQALVAALDGIRVTE